MADARQPLYLDPTALDLAWNDPAENLRRVEAAIKTKLAGSKVAPEARLFLFPELTLTGFVTQSPEPLGVTPPHPHLARLGEIAARHRVAVAAGFPERNPDDPRKPFNTLALVGPDGKIVARYHKNHLFTVGKNPESASYTPGDAGLLVEYRGWKVGFAVCFDIRFPGLFHQYARAGADLVLVSACWIDGPHKTYQYKTINSAHAALTQAFVAAVNRSGKDPFYEYDGSQYVFSPFGEDQFSGGPCELRPAELEAARKLVVRPSDRDAYRVDEVR